MKSLARLLILLAFTTAAVAQPRVHEERPLDRAVRAAQLLLAAGSHGSAMAELEPAIDSASAGDNLADALALQARGNFALKRYHAAHAACGRFLSTYRTDRRAHDIRYIDGVSSYNDADTAGAERHFLIVAADRESRHNRDAHYWLARISLERGRLDEARRYAYAVVLQDDDGSEFGWQSLYIVAWIEETRGEIDTAALRYRSIVERGPEDLRVDAQLRLGVIDARRGHPESAIRLLNSLTPRSDRQREEQLFYLGEMSAALGRYDEALRYDNEYVRAFPTSPRLRQVRFGIGWALTRMQRWDEAVATFRGLERGIDSIAAASGYQIGAIQVARGDTAGAVLQFEALLGRLPYETFSGTAYYQLGRLFYRQRSWDSARHYLLIAARQFPESELRAEAYYLLGESYAALGDASNAQVAFARVRKVGDAGDLGPRSLYREGEMLYKVGRFRSAIDRLREYVAGSAKGPDVADATFWLGEALYQDRTYDEAERYYNAYLEKFGAGRWREPALYGLGWSRLQQKDFKGAALAFSDFIARHKDSPQAVEATIRLADCYRLMGDYTKAIATYESIGGVAGKGARDEEAQFRLAGVFLQMGEVDRSVEIFRKLIKAYPNSPLRDAYAFNIGSIYHEKGRDSLAIAELRVFQVAFPNSLYLPQAVFTLGDVYYNREEFDSALVYYRQVLDEFPASDMVPEALDAVRFTLNAMGRGGDAVAIIDSFQAHNPNLLPADSLNFRKATIVLEQGNTADAITRFRKLLEDYPQSVLAPEALFGIGRAYEYRGARDSALASYARVIDEYAASPAAERAMVEHAGLRLEARQWADAATEYERFAARYPDGERINEARYGVARARLEMKDTAAAVRQLRQVLDSNRDKTEEDLYLDRSRIAYARVLSSQRQYDEAMELLAAVVARRMDDVAAEALLTRGEILYATKDFSGALAELRRLGTDFATFPEFADPGLLLVGTVYEQLTNYVAARDVYTQIIAQTENPAVRTEAETRLKRLKH